MNSTDIKILKFIRDRLVYFYGENKNIDFIISLERIIYKLEILINGEDGSCEE